MALELYPIRLEESTIIELKRRADGHPVAPLIRKIIDGWIGLDDTLQKEQVLKQIDGLTGQINLLNQQLKEIEVKEYKIKVSADTEADRQEYLKSNPKVLEMYKNKSISAQGYKILIADLGFKNKSEVNRWLDEQI